MRLRNRQLASCGGEAFVICGYFDGSNTHDGSKILSLCEFLGDPRIWDDFDAEWKLVLDKSAWPRGARPNSIRSIACTLLESSKNGRFAYKTDQRRKQEGEALVGSLLMTAVRK